MNAIGTSMRSSVFSSASLPSGEMRVVAGSGGGARRARSPRSTPLRAMRSSSIAFRSARAIWRRCFGESELGM